ASTAASASTAAAVPAPAPAQAAAPTPPATAGKKAEAEDDQKLEKGEGAAARKKGHHHGVELAAASAPAAPAAAPGAAAPEASGGAFDLAGVWEGPWTDPEHHQTGRLYLQVGGAGAVSGWFSNATASRSYRLAGRAARPGELDLICQCPANQGFDVHVTVHPTADGDLKGRVALSASAGVFGQSHVVLHRSAPR
ncbi:MAG TPA: hypothetical protein VHO06_01390, partial [Polyangia bacterium]|nr:hypothetical protein [Polyangia bacterium]